MRSAIEHEESTKTQDSRDPLEIEAERIARQAAHALREGAGDKVTILSLSGLTLIADYFVIASAPNQRHVRALADRVVAGLTTKRDPHHIEGYEGGLWILLDYGDVMVHVFREAERAFYGLERLWGDAPRSTLESEEDGKET